MVARPVGCNAVALLQGEGSKMTRVLPGLSMFCMHEAMLVAGG
jgi:hypothetical protein